MTLLTIITGCIRSFGLLGCFSFSWTSGRIYVSFSEFVGISLINDFFDYLEEPNSCWKHGPVELINSFIWNPCVQQGQPVDSKLNAHTSFPSWPSSSGIFAYAPRQVQKLSLTQRFVKPKLQNIGIYIFICLWFQNFKFFLCTSFYQFTEIRYFFITYAKISW